MLTVQELIDKLRGYSPDALVAFVDSDQDGLTTVDTLSTQTLYVWKVAQADNAQSVLTQVSVVVLDGAHALYGERF